MRSAFPSLGFLASRALALALALILAACGGGKSIGPREAAEQFFQHISEGKMKEAYESASFTFQSQQSETGFESVVSELGLKGRGKPELGTPEVTGNLAKLTAEVQATDGQKRTFIVTLHRELGIWRILSLRTPRSVETGLSENRFSLVGKASGLQEAANFPRPDDATIRDLVKEAMGKFSEAITQKSFSDFYDYVAFTWQQSLSRAQLHDAFKGFIESGVNLSVINNLEPRFDTPPQISPDGIMTVAGHYDTQPAVVFFSLKFLYELDLPESARRNPERMPLEGPRSWKLFGIEVNLRQ